MVAGCWPPDPESANKDMWLEVQAAEPSPDDFKLFERNMQEWPLPNVKSGEMIEFRASGLAEAEKRVKINGPFLSKCCFGIQKGILNFHIVVDFLAIKPAFQPQGVANLIREAGCEIADKCDMKMYVIASPAALNFYKGQRFKLVETVSTDYSQFGGVEPYVHHFLVCQPLSPEA